MQQYPISSSTSLSAALLPSLSAPAAIVRPSLALLGIEPWRAALELLSLQFSRFTAPKTGDGHPVIIFPGFATDSSTVAPLRDHCEALGYAAFDWGRGCNVGASGDMDAWLAGLADDIGARLDRHAQKATLIGWSLGGVYARELGKLLAPRLRQVITIGTPFNASADHTNVGWLLGLMGGAAPRYTEALSERLRTPPPLPTTSIYSRSDGVVAWQTCRHSAESAWVQDIEIDGSHSGMAWNPAVLRVVADRLAQHPATWQPYAPR